MKRLQSSLAVVLLIVMVACAPAQAPEQVEPEVEAPRVAILTAITGVDYLLSVAIVWALTSFIGTLALAKHLMGKGLNE